MSVNTDIYILSYDQGKLGKALLLENFQLMRFDDGIYGQVWDAENRHYPEIRQIHMDRYSLTEAEYNLLLFYNYSTDDLYEDATGEGEPALNFNKIPADKRAKASTLKAILVKAYQKEKQISRKYDKDFFDALNKSRGEEVEKKSREYLQTKPVPEFLHLLGYIIGCLTVMEQKDEEVQIVFCQE